MARVFSRRQTTFGLAVALILVLSVGCGSSAATQPDRVRVVATTGLLADIAGNVGGELVEVTAIVPPGAEVHSFQSTPDDSVSVSRADLIVANGGGFDAFLDPVLKGSKNPDATIVVASEGLSNEAEVLGGDPHFWQNPLNTVIYVENIRDGLAAADPENTSTYRANAATYTEELLALDQEIASILDAVPEARRHLYTLHNAFAHFASRYGWTSTGLLSVDADDATPDALVDVIQQARRLDIRAFFTEPQFDSSLLERAAEEAGVAIGTIYSDTLDSQVTSYVEMMRFNANSLAGHLK